MTAENFDKFDKLLSIRQIFPKPSLTQLNKGIRQIFTTDVKIFHHKNLHYTVPENFGGVIWWIGP